MNRAFFVTGGRILVVAATIVGLAMVVRVGSGGGPSDATPPASLDFENDRVLTDVEPPAPTTAAVVDAITTAPPNTAEPSPTTPTSTTAPATTTPTSTTAPSSAPPSTEPTEQPTPASDATPLDGGWSTRGAQIVDAAGEPVTVRAISWFGFDSDLNVPHGLWERNWADLVDQVAELGFNTLRLPFSSAMLEPGVMPVNLREDVNTDLVGLTSIEVMDAIVERAAERGLAVILERHALGADDRHHLWYDRDHPPERFISDWELLAERYADDANVIGADLYNEPHDGACWGCGDPAIDWRLAATAAGDAVHRIAPHWLVFVAGVEHVAGDRCTEGGDGCTWWGANLAAAADAPIELVVPNKVVYIPRDYGSSVFEQPWFDDPGYPDNLPGRWERFWGSIARDDLAPLVVQIGTRLDDERDGVWFDTMLGYLDELDAGFAFWSLNPNSAGTGGLLEDDWTTVDADKMARLEPYLPGPFP